MSGPRSDSNAEVTYCFVWELLAGRAPIRSSWPRLARWNATVAAAEVLAIKDDPADLAEIHAIQQDMAALRAR